MKLWMRVLALAVLPLGCTQTPEYAGEILLGTYQLTGQRLPQPQSTCPEEGRPFDQPELQTLSPPAVPVYLEPKTQRLRFVFGDTSRLGRLSDSEFYITSRSDRKVQGATCPAVLAETLSGRLISGPEAVALGNDCEALDGGLPQLDGGSDGGSADAGPSADGGRPDGMDVPLICGRLDDELIFDQAHSTLDDGGCGFSDCVIRYTLIGNRL